MNGKELLHRMVMAFFIVVTLVNVATFFMGIIFEPDMEFGYEAFLSPLLFGVCSMIPTALIYSSKELSVKQTVFRKILQLVVLEIIMSALIFTGRTPEIIMVVVFCASVAVVFVLANLILAAINANTAKLLTRELEEFQSRQ